MDKRFYPWLLLALSLGVVWHFAASYYNFTRGDAAIEYKVYLAIVNGKPMPFNSPNLMVSCLTTTYFPAMLQRLTHLDHALLFRYYAIPLMIWAPFVVYWLAARFVSPLESFCVGVLFLAQPYFVVAPMVSRIVIGNTLFTLSVLILLQENMRQMVRIGLLSLITVLLVVTAYSVAFLAIAFYVGWFVLGSAYSWFRPRIRQQLVSLIALLVVVAVAGIIWMKFITWLPWAMALEMLRDTFSGANVQDGMAAVAFGQTFWVMNNAQRIEFLLTWGVMGLISLGLLFRIGHISFGQAGAIVGYGLLVGGLILPVWDAYFGVQRIYFCVSPLLLIFAVYGMRWLAQNRARLVLSVGTTAYFLAGSGLLYYLMGYDRFVH